MASRAGRQVAGHEAGQRQAVAGLAAALGVLDLHGDSPCTGEAIERSRRIILIQASKSLVGEVQRFVIAVADLPGDGQRLLVELDGAARLPQGGVGVPQVAQLMPSPRRSPISRLMASACS